MPEEIPQKGFLGLTQPEWRRGLAWGGLMIAPDRRQLQIVEPLTPEQELAKARDLGHLIIEATNELAMMPRDALIGIAWRGIANYHKMAATWGEESSTAKKAFVVKEFRMGYLTSEERKSAIRSANNWLDDHFDK